MARSGHIVAFRGTADTSHGLEISANALSRHSSKQSYLRSGLLGYDSCL